MEPVFAEFEDVCFFRNHRFCRNVGKEEIVGWQTLAVKKI